MEIPSEIDNPNGLHCKYVVRKSDGSVSDPRAIYFVLRLDSFGKDEKHIEACRFAARNYANYILMNQDAPHLNQMAMELQELLIDLEKVK